VTKWQAGRGVVVDLGAAEDGRRAPSHGGAGAGDGAEGGAAADGGRDGVVDGCTPACPTRTSTGREGSDPSVARRATTIRMVAAAI